MRKIYERNQSTENEKQADVGRPAGRPQQQSPWETVLAWTRAVLVKNTVESGKISETLRKS